MNPTSEPAPTFNPADFAGRWRRARASALAAAASRPGGLGEEVEGEEADRVRALDPSAREDLSRLVALSSWKLGSSLADRIGPVDDPERLAGLLEASGIPCALAIRSEEPGSGLRLDRLPCCAVQRREDEGGAEALCDFYRDALDGFVCGVSRQLRYGRRVSPGRGGDRCADVLFPASRPEARFEPVPPEVSEHLAGPLAAMRQRDVALRLLGLAENRLVVLAEAGRSTACGLGKIYLDALAAHLAKAFPFLELVDATPRAVMA